MQQTAKRTGRPLKPAVPGARMSLGLKVTPEIKTLLDEAARANGRTQSQEAEARLEQSFERQQHLVLSYGRHWAPAFIVGNKLVFLVSQGSPADTLVLKLNREQMTTLREYFGVEE